MKKRKTLFGTLLVAATAMVLAACGETVPDLSENGAEADSTEELSVDTSSGDTLVIGMANQPASSNPFYAIGTSEVWAMNFYYETLVNQESSTSFVPRLGDITTEDSQTFTVTLNPDAHWTDREPVTADDVAFTLNTIAHPDTLSTVATEISTIEGTDESGKMAAGEESLSGVEVVDEHTLTLTTKEPVDINYFKEKVGTGVMIAPEHVFAEIPKAEIQTSEPATNPTVTNGAYEFVEYSEDNYLHLTANEDYYLGAPKIKDIYIRVLTNEAMVTELQSGGIHMVASGGIGDVTHQDIELIADNENLVIEENPSPNVQYLFINSGDEAFADNRVRQALAYAIDYDLTIDNLLLGHGEALAAPYSSANDYKDDSLEPYPYDPDQAVALLEEAGFDFNQTYTLTVPTGNTLREQNADLIEQQLEAIGIDIQQEAFDFATVTSNLSAGDFQLAMYGMGHEYDPDLSSFIGTGGASNHMQYSSEEMDSLLSQGKALVDADERYTVYEQVQALFKEDSPAIPLYSEAVYSVQAANLDGGIESFWPASLIGLHEWEFTE